MTNWKEQYKRIFLGLGFDAKDGHKRITKGQNFYLYGGSKTTHSGMQEMAMKFNEQLKKRHKTLDDISKSEFLDIADKIGIKNIEELINKNKRF
ncbi:hypothetical protein ACFL96_06110 [Thermoproteota archaeon]